MDEHKTLRDKIIPILAPYVRWVALFGSAARGEMSRESDIDLLVALKPPHERPPLGLRWFGLAEELAQVLGREVDLVSEDALSPYLRPYIERDKVILYEG